MTDRADGWSSLGLSLLLLRVVLHAVQGTSLDLNGLFEVGDENLSIFDLLSKTLDARLDQLT